MKKSHFIWNMFGTIIASCLSSILLLIVVRINGVEIAGIFSIAFATSVILNAVGDFGIRILQVTDIKQQYTFGEYMALRIIVVFVMIVLGIIFIIVSHYDIDKAYILFFLILFRAVDNFSESYQAQFQLSNRLDLAGKTLIIRNSISCVAFFLVDILTHNIIISTLALFITNLILLGLLDYRWKKHFVKDKIHFTKEKCIEILKEALPVCISTILALYLTNAVKYAIDLVGNNEMQTYYNIIYLPAFTINLLSTCIMKPILKLLAESFEQGDMKKLVTLILKVILLTFGATIVIILICMTIGIPILEYIFGLKLDNYRNEFVILLVSGFFYSVSILLFYALSTIRKQKWTIYVYMCVSVLAYFLTKIFVKELQMTGAALGNITINCLLVVALGILFIIFIKKRRRIST